MSIEQYNKLIPGLIVENQRGIRYIIERQLRDKSFTITANKRDYISLNENNYQYFKLVEI